MQETIPESVTLKMNGQVLSDSDVLGFEHMASSAPISFQVS